MSMMERLISSTVSQSADGQPEGRGKISQGPEAQHFAGFYDLAEAGTARGFVDDAARLARVDPGA